MVGVIASQQINL